MADLPAHIPLPALDQTRLRQTLAVTLERTSPVISSVDYCLIGTAAAVLHGVALAAGDVDFVMQQRASVDAFSTALAAFPCRNPPTYISEGRQYYTAYDIDGVKVEASTVEWETDSASFEAIGRGPWEHVVHFEVGPYRVPTIKLELRLVTELLRNRADRYTALIAWMHFNGYDIDLLRRAMSARSLPRLQQERVLAQLSNAV